VVVKAQEEEVLLLQEAQPRRKALHSNKVGSKS
jgi:hypothetical protein